MQEKQRPGEEPEFVDLDELLGLAPEAPPGAEVEGFPAIDTAAGDAAGFELSATTDQAVREPATLPPETSVDLDGAEALGSFLETTDVPDLHLKLRRFARHNLKANGVANGARNADDVVSEAWTGIIAAARRGAFVDKGPDERMKIIWTIARRKVIDAHRKNYRDLPFRADLPHEGFPGILVPSTEDKVIGDLDWFYKIVRDHVQKRRPSDVHQIVEILAHRPDISITELREIFTKSPGATRVARHRAMNILRELAVKAGLGTPTNDTADSGEPSEHKES